MTYSVEFRPSVRKDIRHIPKKDLIKIKNKIDEISVNLPDPATTGMRGNTNLHRVRCGNYLIIYQIHENRLVILVVTIGHRKDVYRNL